MSYAIPTPIKKGKFMSKIINSALVCLAVLFPALSQTSIRGVVLNQDGAPVPGARVTLNDSYSKTTSTDGTFSFHSSTAARTPSPSLSKKLFHISNSSVIINNPRSQKVSLSIFDLCGKVLYRQRSMLGSGKHSFALPSFLKNKTVILNFQAGHTNEHVRLTGLCASKPRAEIGTADLTEHAEAVSNEHNLLVSHSFYDDKSVVAYNGDSVVVRLNRKLNRQSLNRIEIGDTLSFETGKVTLSLDSIRDDRCDVMLCVFGRGTHFCFSH